jgi:catechol 2,3-dioxygenase-like lactoylglutathione lyase family enzyme
MADRVAALPRKGLTAEAERCSPSPASELNRRRSSTALPVNNPLPSPALSEIGQIAITVSDVARATAFYRDVLGLRFLFSAGPNLAFLAAGSVRLMLTTAQGHGEAGKNSTLYFKVGDIVAAHAALIARGAKDERAPQLTARMPDHKLWMAFVRDPDGNLVGLMSEVRPAT